MNRYEIDQRYKEIQDIIYSNDGELPEELEELFDKVCEDRNTKITNIIRFLRNLRSDENSIDQEIERLSKMETALNAKYNRLKTYLATVIGENNKWQSPEGVISWRKVDIVNIIDESLLPDAFIKTKTVTSIDKILLKNAIKAGNNVPGAEIVTNNHMQIK
jgi:hypothetical protein